MITYEEVFSKEVNNPKIFYLIERIRDVGNRFALLNWFTPCQRPTVTDIPDNLVGINIIRVSGKVQELEAYKELFAVHVPKKKKELSELDLTDPTDDMYVYGVYTPEGIDDAILLCKIVDNALEPPFRMDEKFLVEKGMIDNYGDNPPVLTDVGKFILNQLILVEPFGNLIPYWNETFNPAKLDDIVAKLILERQVTREMYNKYMNYGYWYGEDGSIATATWSEKSLTTDPNVPAKKKELLDKYKENLNDPLVLAEIEKELIAMDKAYLKGDSSEPFYAVTAGKTFNEQRKKMFLTFGLTVAFDKNTGNYEFVEESLADGWTIQNLDIASNDVRRGSYGRGIETAKGGEQTKFVLRIFQEVSIDEEDCGSKKGIKVLITEHNYKQYFGRWMVNGVLFDKNNADQFIGKTIELRGPQYCKTKPGFCFKCVGELFRKLDMKAIGMNAVIITSTMTSVAMKSMHVSGIDLYEIEDFHRFLR